MLWGVVGCVGDDSVCEGGFSVHGDLYVVVGAVYGGVQEIDFASLKE